MADKRAAVNSRSLYGHHIALPTLGLLSSIIENRAFVNEYSILYEISNDKTYLFVKQICIGSL
jgi:hypothetical protein